jgi:hypothetical protein
MIFALLGKDLRKMWLLAIAFAVFSIVICAVLFQEDYIRESSYGSGAALIMSGMMLYMLVFGGLMNIEKYEEKHNGYKMMAVLPLPNSILVTVKYGILFVSTLVGIVYLLIVLKAFGVMENAFGQKLNYLLICGFVGLAANGLMYVGIFKHSYHRMRAVTMVIYIGMLIGPQLLHFLLQMRGDEAGFIRIIDSVPVIGVWLITAVSLAVYWGSCYVSIRNVRPEE